MPRTDAVPSFAPAAEAGPDEVVYRRRQEDWLSGAAPPSEEPGGAARRAAIEVAKATLIARDGLTSDHSDDVGVLCTAMARELNLEERSMDNLKAAAQLHDIGKVAIPESILHKPGPLSAAEWDLIREHTIVGEQILASVPELIGVARLVRHSHEHWDGSGYPDGLSGEGVPLESRIILCADAFHAVRSPRPYRAGRPAAEAYEEIERHSGTQFDPAVVKALGQTIKATERRRRAARALRRSRPVFGNRRLPALLLALAISGSALAALSGGIDGGGQAEASAEPPPCCLIPPVSVLPPVHLSEAANAAAARRVAQVARRAPVAGRASASARQPRGGTTSPSRAAASRSQAASPSASAPALTKAEGRTKSKVPPPYGKAHAYGHEKRLQNPHPPGPPPGRVKP